MKPSYLLALAASIAQHAAAVDNVTAVLTTSAISGHLPTNFAGFSYEVSCVPTMFTLGAGNPRTSFVNLMQNLQSISGAEGPNIRIGGNSGDESVYQPGNAPLPNGDNYRITDADFQAYELVVPTWNGSITLDVNFRNPSDPSEAVAHVTNATRFISWASNIIDGIEIGNEVDLFFENGIRSPSYVYSDYKSEFALYANALKSAGIPQPKIQGATFCCGHFDTDLPDYINTFGPQNLLSSISYHNYPLNVCGTNPPKPTIYQLLADKSAQYEAQHLQPYVNVAAANKVPFYIGEGNSVACGGAYNVSNVFAATLWAVDVMMNMASVGITRWNFHGCPEGAYTAIAYPQASSNVPDVRPLYYGIWAFTAATANHARLFDVSITYTTNPMVKIWNSVDVSNNARTVIIHKDPNATDLCAVVLSPPAGKTFSGAATLSRMAPDSDGAKAEYGIKFAGQTFDGSQDGKPIGVKETETVVVTNNQYSFYVAPASIVILEYPSPF